MIQPSDEIVEFMKNYYNLKYGDQSMGSNICNRYPWMEQSAILAAHDIENIMASR